MTVRPALTLVEVVASLVIVGTSGAMLMTAHARSLEQLQTSRLQETAARLAEELLAEWKLESTDQDAGMTHLVREEGDFEEEPGWRWTRIAQPYDVGSDGRLLENILTLYKQNPRGEEKRVSRYVWLERTREPKS